MESQLPGQVVLGYSKPIYPRQASFWQKNARLWWEDMYNQMRQPGHRFSYRDFFSGNVSMSAELFQRIGGFDDRINTRLEDYEMGMRLLEAGVRFHFAPRALAHHYDETNLTLWLQRSHLEGIADVQIVRRHPKLRTERFARSDPGESWRGMRRIANRSAISGGRISDWFASRMLNLARICEKFKLRKPWWLAIGILREYHYWRGVASELGSRRATEEWILNSPVTSSTSDPPLVIDLADPIDAIKMRVASDRAEQEGLKIMWRGLDLFEIPPEPGKEPLREEHLWAFFQKRVAQEFLPALAIDLIQSGDSERSIWR